VDQFKSSKFLLVISIEGEKNEGFLVTDVYGGKKQGGEKLCFQHDFDMICLGRVHQEGGRHSPCSTRRKQRGEEKIRMFHFAR